MARIQQYLLESEQAAKRSVKTLQVRKTLAVEELSEKVFFKNNNTKKPISKNRSDSNK